MNHAWHISYEVFTMAGVELPKQETVPVYRSPLADERGKPMLDYVITQTAD